MLTGINGSYNYYENGMTAQEGKRTKGIAEEEGEAKNQTEDNSKIQGHITEENKNIPGKMPVPKDQYINNREEEYKPSGLYYLGKDEYGNKKIFFDNPEKTGKENENTATEGLKKQGGKCTGNTDSVDREIEKLKEEKKQLEKQIKDAAGDKEKVKELEKKLAQTEMELSQKDNDTYRRSHSSFSMEA